MSEVPDAIRPTCARLTRLEVALYTHREEVARLDLAVHRAEQAHDAEAAIAYRAVLGDALDDLHRVEGLHAALMAQLAPAIKEGV